MSTNQPDKNPKWQQGYLWKALSNDTLVAIFDVFSVRNKSATILKKLTN
jgi:hypothetical protein